jgi:hypothetical protein
VRWLVAPLVVVGSPLAHAIVIMEPALVAACPRAKTWAEVPACISKHGLEARVIRELREAKLVVVERVDGPGRIEEALAIYIRDHTEWRIAGLLELDGTSTRTEVTAFERVTVTGHQGFRVDLGQITSMSVSTDGVVARPAQRLMRSQLYCSGINYWCSDVIASCDTLIDGKTYYTFHGTTRLDGGSVLVVGDRTASNGCNSPQSQSLGWPVR